MIVRVPASSANLGSGFDVLGVALSMHALIGIVGDDPMPARARELDGHHPATLAFGRGGGQGRLWLRCPIPMGRGLGFSGATRVAGLVAAHAQRHGPDPELLAVVRPSLLALATELEGHADNVAASLLGGVVATAGGRAVRVPVALDPAVVVWIPRSKTLTDRSRSALRAQVPFADAVFNLGRATLLVAALAAGDVDALRTAVEDRLHQDLRLLGAPDSRRALEVAHDAGAWCAWLSGSGPSVAALCDPQRVDAVAEALRAIGRGEGQGGDTRVVRLTIDQAGAVVGGG